MPKTRAKGIVAYIALLLAGAAPALAQNCPSDQKQLLHPGGMPLGARTVLSQTFIPTAPGQRVCRVKLMITKNVAGAANLTLRLLRSDFTALGAGVTIPGGAIPMGNSVQLFEFGCKGLPLAGMPFYGLRLESSESPLGAYSWQGAANDPYVKPGSGGRGWRNPNAGAGNWSSLGGWDFAFEIYMCS